jgi:hypothetical protein
MKLWIGARATVAPRAVVRDRVPELALRILMRIKRARERTLVVTR